MRGVLHKFYVLPVHWPNSCLPNESSPSILDTSLPVVILQCNQMIRDQSGDSASKIWFWRDFAHARHFEFSGSGYEMSLFLVLHFFVYCWDLKLMEIFSNYCLNSAVKSNDSWPVWWQGQQNLILMRFRSREALRVRWFWLRNEPFSGSTLFRLLLGSEIDGNIF